MTLCGPARDTVLSNLQTGKLNFDLTLIAYQLVRIVTPWELILVSLLISGSNTEGF
jgi:hypothetical protein